MIYVVCQDINGYRPGQLAGDPPSILLRFANTDEEVCEEYVKKYTDDDLYIVEVNDEIE